MGRPAHATWYVPRVSVPPALQALTCRLGAAAHPCNVRACSHPGRCRSGDAPLFRNRDRDVNILSTVTELDQYPIYIPILRGQLTNLQYQYLEGPKTIFLDTLNCDWFEVV